MSKTKFTLFGEGRYVCDEFEQYKSKKALCKPTHATRNTPSDDLTIVNEGRNLVSSTV